MKPTALRTHIVIADYYNDGDDNNIPWELYQKHQ